MLNPGFKTVSRPLVPPALVGLIAFGSGIVIDRHLDLYWGAYLTIALAGLVSWLACDSVQRLEITKLFSLLIACAAIGGYWHHGSWNWFPSSDISVYAGATSTPVCVQARIVGEGKYFAKTSQQLFETRPEQVRTTFLIRPFSIRHGRSWKPLGGIANLVIHQPTDEFAYGDRVLIYGSLVATRLPTSPGQFNFQDFYRGKSLGASIHVYERDSVLLQDSNAWMLTGFRTRIRRQLDRDVWKYVGKDQAPFASAVLLGNREQLGHDLRDRFVATGTAHLLAISGLHVGILASMFLLLYRVGWLDRKTALWSTIIFVVVYAWLVEFRPPVTRAAILLSLYCGGRLLGRSGFELNLLALAGILILMINPTDLFMLGPQLSFLAVASLIMFKQHIFRPLSNDPIDVLIRGTRPWYGRLGENAIRRCNQAVMVSGLIWLVSLPLIASNYHLVTPISLIANPLVMIPMAIALFCGLGVCIFGVLFPSLAEAFGWGAEQSLAIVQNIVDFASGVEHGHWWTAGPMAMALPIFYLAVSTLAWVQPRNRFRWLFSIALLWFSLFWILPIHAQRMLSGSSKTQFTFIDVGHGSSVWMRTQQGQNILFDAGSMSSSRFAAQTISGVLWANQVEHIDAIIISHADLDHFNAIPELIQRFSIGKVFMSAPMAASTHPVVAELEAQLAASSIQVERLSRGFVAKVGNAQRLEILLPPRSGTGGNDNSNSIVVSAEWGDWRVLLPGDLEGIGMHALLQLPSLECDLVAMPHHGSKNSQPEEFVKWSRPDHVVVSASATRIDRDVVATIARKGPGISPTGDLGSIQARFDEHSLRMVHWHRDRWAELPGGVRFLRK